MLTASEVAELRAYYDRMPFDDESTFHVPTAGLAALYVNSHKAEGSPIVTSVDFLAFKPQPTEDEEADEMDAKIIGFMKRQKDPE